eukprot:949550_1
MSRGQIVNNHSNNPFGPASPEFAVPSNEPPKIVTNPFDATPGLLEGIIFSPNRDIIATNNDEGEAYAYNTNHSKGAVMLNDYDWNRKGSRLKYDYKKVDAELPKYLLWFRKGLYVVQMLVIAGAILMAIGAYIAENNGWNFTPTDHGLKYGHMEEELIYLPYSAAGICLVTAIIGFVGAKTRKECGKIMLIVYIICVVMCCILSIASTVQAFADMGNRYHYAERQWDALTAVEEKRLEWHHYCCNFYTIEPCCRFGYGDGDCVNEYYCFEKVEEHLIEQFTIIGVTSGIQAFNLLCISLGSMVLYCYMSYKTYKKKKK